MKSVSRCTWNGNAVVAEAIDTKNVKRRVMLQDVRAGLIFPAETLPGYYVLFGREIEAKSVDKHKFLFMSEGESHTHDTLFSKLTDDCSKFKCKTVYAKLKRQDRRGGVGGYDDLWRYIKAKKLSINLIPAPAADDVEYGKTLLGEYWLDGCLDIPDFKITPTKLRAQIKKMDQDADISPDIDTLYSFHAFRYLISGFTKFANVIPYSPRQKQHDKASQKGWT